MTISDCSIDPCFCPTPTVFQVRGRVAYAEKNMIVQILLQTAINHLNWNKIIIYVVAAPTMLYASDKLTGKKPPALNSTLLLWSCVEKSWSSVELSRSNDWRRSNLWTTVPIRRASSPAAKEEAVMYSIPTKFYFPQYRLEVALKSLFSPVFFTHDVNCVE